MTTTAAHDTPRTARFGVQGMTCASCVRRVERALSAVPGIEQASVNLATEEASVTFADGSMVEADALRAAVNRAGYTLRTAEAGEGEDESHDRVEAERRAEMQSLKTRTWFSLVIAAVLMAGMQWEYIPGIEAIPARVMHPLFFVLATPVQFWAGWRFYSATWRI